MYQIDKKDKRNLRIIKFVFLNALIFVEKSGTIEINRYNRFTLKMIAVFYNRDMRNEKRTHRRK